MRLDRVVADVVNVSRTGVLIRTSGDFDPASEWPAILEFDSVLVRVAARVVRKEPASSRSAPGSCLVALTFVQASASVQAVLKDLCGPTRTGATGPGDRRATRWPRLSFVRCCPTCGSVSIERSEWRHYECLECGREFVGFRIANLRIAI